MNRHYRSWVLATLAAGLAACSPPPPEPDVDLARLQQEVQEHTERLYWIHLRLDTAIQEIGDAQDAVDNENLSAARYHAGEAYRAVDRADQALLELGEQLQKLVNLDQRG